MTIIKPVICTRSRAFRHIGQTPLPRPKSIPSVHTTGHKVNTIFPISVHLIFLPEAEKTNKKISAKGCFFQIKATFAPDNLENTQRWNH